MGDHGHGHNSAFKVDGQRGGVYVGKAGDARGTKEVSMVSAASVEGLTGLVPGRGGSSTVGGGGASTSTETSSSSGGPSDDKSTREALKFFFSNDGRLVREFVLEEVCNTVDALSRDATRELLISLGRCRVEKNFPSLLSALVLILPIALSCTHQY